MIDLIIKIFNNISRFLNPEFKYYKDHRKHPLYKKKKKVVKNIWICSGIFMLFFIGSPNLIGVVFAVSLLTTFVAFMILDETYYPPDDKDL